MLEFLVLIKCGLKITMIYKMYKMLVYCRHSSTIVVNIYKILCTYTFESNKVKIG